MNGIAYSMLPTRFEDGRHTAIEKGLQAVGFRIVNINAPPTTGIGPGDVAVTWNAYGHSGKISDQIAAAGGTAIVCEEAYIRRVDGEKYFAIGIGGHNGAGHFRVGGPERWASWEIPIKPWREDGRHVLVCGQRGFGYNAMAMPDDWPDRVFAELRKVTDRPIHFRAHPKRRRKMPTAPYDVVTDFNQPLVDQLVDAWACVVWSSSSGVTALLEGVPVTRRAPHTVIEVACAYKWGSHLPLVDRRAEALQTLSWGQWSQSEIARGVPFNFNGIAP